MIVIIWAKYIQANGYGGSLNLFKTSEKSTGASMPPLNQQSPWELWLSRKEGQASETGAIPREAPNTVLPSMHSVSTHTSSAQFLSFR